MGVLPLLLDSPMNRNPGPALCTSGEISSNSQSAVKLYQEYYVNVIIRTKVLVQIQGDAETPFSLLR
jgi:hypothetical protein